MKNNRIIKKTIRFCIAGAACAALLFGGVSSPAINASEWTVSETDLFPERLTVENPGMLGEVPLPASPYGTLSWSDTSFVLTSYSQNCQIKLIPGSGLDLSYMSGYRADTGAVFGSVTVIVNSLAPSEESSAPSGEQQDKPEEKVLEAEGSNTVETGEDLSEDLSDISIEESEMESSEESIEEYMEISAEDTNEESPEISAEETSAESQEESGEEYNTWSLTDIETAEQEEITSEPVSGPESENSSESEEMPTTAEESVPEDIESQEKDLSDESFAESASDSEEVSLTESVQADDSSEDEEVPYEEDSEAMILSGSIEIPNLADTPSIPEEESEEVISSDAESTEPADESESEIATADAIEEPEEDTDTAAAAEVSETVTDTTAAAEESETDTKTEEQAKESTADGKTDEPAEAADNEASSDTSAVISESIWDAALSMASEELTSKSAVFDSDSETESDGTGLSSKAMTPIGNSILEDDDDDLVNAQPAATNTPVPTKAYSSPTPVPDTMYGSVSNTTGQSNYGQSQTGQNNYSSGTDVETSRAMYGTGASTDYYGRSAVATGDETDTAGILLAAVGSLAIILYVCMLKKRQRKHVE